MFTAFTVTGAFVIDAAARALCEDYRAGLTAWGKHEAAALELGITKQRLSLQVQAHQLPASLGRTSALDARFWVPFLKARAPRFGLVVLESTDVQRLVDGVERLIEARKPMARAHIKETA